jgi:hypothetical protein
MSISKITLIYILLLPGILLASGSNSSSASLTFRRMPESSCMLSSISSSSNSREDSWISMQNSLKKGGQLIKAVQRNDLEGVKKALAQGANPNFSNFQSYNGRTALYYAAGKGNCAIMQTLLDARAEVEKRSYSTNERPLHNAVRFGRVQAIKMLLAHGADINSFEGFVMRPLEVAILCKQLAAQDTLLRLGVNEGNYIAGLRIAFENNDIALVQRLLNSGLGINQRLGLRGDSSLHIALGHNARPAMIRFLLSEKADVNAEIIREGEFGRCTPYMYVLRMSKSVIMPLMLLRAGADKKIIRKDLRVLAVSPRKDELIRHSPMLYLAAAEYISPEERARLIRFSSWASTKFTSSESLSFEIRRHNNDEVQEMNSRGLITIQLIHERDRYGMNPWLWAYVSGNREAAQLCMEVSRRQAWCVRGCFVRCMKRIGRGPKSVYFDSFCCDLLGDDAWAIAARRGDKAMLQDLYTYRAPIRAGVVSLIKRKWPYFIKTVAERIAEFLHGPRIVLSEPHDHDFSLAGD